SREIRPWKKDKLFAGICTGRPPRRFCDAVADQRSHSRDGSAGRVLARWPAEPLQSPAGADVVRLFSERHARLHELSCGTQVDERTLAEGADGSEQRAMHPVSRVFEQ